MGFGCPQFHWAVPGWHGILRPMLNHVESPSVAAMSSLWVKVEQRTYWISQWFRYVANVISFGENYSVAYPDLFRSLFFPMSWFFATFLNSWHAIAIVPTRKGLGTSVVNLPFQGWWWWWRYPPSLEMFGCVVCVKAQAWIIGIISPLLSLNKTKRWKKRELIQLGTCGTCKISVETNEGPEWVHLSLNGRPESFSLRILRLHSYKV